MGGWLGVGVFVLGLFVCLFFSLSSLYNLRRGLRLPGRGIVEGCVRQHLVLRKTRGLMKGISPLESGGGGAAAGCSERKILC